MEEEAVERMWFIHLRTGHSISAQFNPSEIEESLEANFGRLPILGASSQPMLFLQTNNLKVGFELGFDAISIRGMSVGGGLDGVAMAESGERLTGPSGGRPDLARRFLMACCYRNRGGSNVDEGAPSRVLLVYPGMYSLAMRLTSVTFGHRRFRRTGGTTLFSAKLAFEYDPDVPLTYEDVLEHGWQRDGTNAEA
jgi:hypothetical protein